MQQLLVEDTLLGLELLELRDALEVSDGTSESTSESSSSLDVSPMYVRLSCAESCASSAAEYCSLMTCFVWFGLYGRGDLILLGEMERPLGMSTDMCRRCDLLERLDGAAATAGVAPDDGTSRMFSLRPVVGSTVCSFAGSCDTWYPSMMY